jgi:hypothetical protein
MGLGKLDDGSFKAQRFLRISPGDALHAVFGQHHRRTERALDHCLFIFIRLIMKRLAPFSTFQSLEIWERVASLERPNRFELLRCLVADNLHR